MKDSLILLSNFIKHPKQVGAIAPSSKFLARQIIKSADVRNSKTIVELGPGLGAFTREILRRAHKDSRILAFEVNKKFCSHLENNFKDKRLNVINARAEHVSKELTVLGVEKADCIISGLPFRNFSDKQKNIILSEVKSSLKPGGKFVLFQYTNGLIRLLESHFDRVERTFVALNVPPAFVYICE